MKFLFEHFIEALKLNLRVINAVILREISSRYGGSRLGYIWAIVNPIISIICLYLVFRLIRQRDMQGISLMAFLITGWFTYGFYQSLVATVANAEAGNRALLMHQPVTRMDVMLARGTLETLTTTAFFIVAVGIAFTIEPTPWPEDMGLVAASLGAAGLLGTGLGLVMGAIMTYFPVAMNFLAPINRIGFFVSGPLFLVASLPSWTHKYLRWNPMIHPVEGIRQGWFEAYSSPILDLSFTYAIAFPLVALGLHLERRSRRGIKL